MELFAKLDATNTTIITPNRRLSATILKKFNEHQVTQNITCWPTLDILPFNNWIQRLWQNYCQQDVAITPLILTQEQEQILWEEILNQAPTNDALLQLSATAELAKSAWGILKQWQVNPNQSAFELTEDSCAFQLWAKEFQKICTERNWLDANSLLDLLSEKIINGDIKLPPKIILTGFTEYTPQQKKFFGLCAEYNTQVSYHFNQCLAPNRSIQRVALIDEDTEIKTMALWAKSLLQPSASINIGCVVPNLEKVRDKILHTFSNIFSAEHTFTLNPTTLPFNISAGKTLSTYAIINSALQLLSLNNKTLSAANISHLLHSPFLGDAENERIKRAHFDTRLHNTNTTPPSLNALLDTNEKINLTKSCPQLAERLLAFTKQTEQLKKNNSPSEWVAIFVELLTLLGWPGERSLNSQEYQVVQRWLELLQEFQSLDAILPLQTYQQALHYLNRLASKTIFQIQSPAAPIQILGLLEAAEIPFDHLWVMGLDDTTWPPAAKPNPFIPQRLQKNLSMPHANAEKELIYSTQLTTQLQNSSPHCVFSHALKNDDSELRPSALIAQIKEIPLEELRLESNAAPAQIIFQTKDLDIIQDDQAPSIQPNETLHGGVRIFKQQAACPFKAFAEIRLHAQPMEELKIGLRAQDRGTIVHKALELVWQVLKSSEFLINLNDDDLMTLITECGTRAIEKTTSKKVAETRYLGLELQRVEKLLFAWLQHEKSRPAFHVIAQEKEHSMTIGGIPLTMRVDRVDAVADGSHLIIDYKTGKNNQIKAWFSDRPDEPQLPLYCLMDPSKTSGIAFAEIHPDTLTFKGIAHEETGIPAITPINKVNYAEQRTWEQQIAHWQTVLTQLGTDFQHGQAKVNPKSDETCQYCHLQVLCRINEKIEPLC
jgi:ATP-dependent helicase/nuclease subunit B